MKRTFTTPFWFLLALFIFFVIFGIFTIGMLRQVSRGRYSTPSTWMYFVQPGLVLAEALTYWIIRKKNKARRASWTHVIVMTAAFFSSLLKGPVYSFYDDFSPNIEITTFVNNVEIVFFLLFWSLLLIAHIFFIRVLRQARTSHPQDGKATDEHLLDDVLS